jgi:hypothetical protein
MRSNRAAPHGVAAARHAAAERGGAQGQLADILKRRHRWWNRSLFAMPGASCFGVRTNSGNPNGEAGQNIRTKMPQVDGHSAGQRGVAQRSMRRTCSINLTTRKSGAGRRAVGRGAASTLSRPRTNPPQCAKLSISGINPMERLKAVPKRCGPTRKRRQAPSSAAQQHTRGAIARPPRVRTLDLEATQECDTTAH